MGFNNPSWTWSQLEAALSGRGRDGRAPGSPSWNAGGDTPAHPSAWCKVQQGWVTVENVTADGPVSLPDVKDSRTVHRMWTGGAQGSEYFLLEHRRRTGYDSELPGDGLLVSERLPIEILGSADSQRYLRTKKDKLGHLLSSV